MSPTQLQRSLQQYDIELTAQQMQQLQQYFQLLVETNRVMNLTNITSEADVYLKHFYDSLMPMFVEPALKQAVTLADIGSGAGFPGLVLKIVNPNLQLTIVDSLQKRINFLAQVVQTLGLQNVTLIHARAEEFGRQKKYREQFDYVTARAVANLPVLLELCLPVVKNGGTFIALKGAKAQAELQQSQHALTILGGQVQKVETMELPEQAGQRELLFIEKVKSTPNKYPRKAGTPAKEPLL
ncbi:16S rRNA (guanine(527)-N(7))-methyltransferase RsmG [Bombilactobacillus thymidiniphilus]|uniref:Ribosomal RNA small subunit methyltransferase G n=1 Tax=Bombilactobacillus thymidiniphilus TaxID=2923363 RepID=A0ABY4PBT6_9LACO|nr:16S rRNA (guanine(527)-N(7))-methyltransferase RsmG [Bombilactobacillus thymidiniphilus]UQS83019.1 16S rRNA (guanine(527)-N(7))-methyltransferase RsmG [Bombilactobacillus thymidiniphilus]